MDMSEIDRAFSDTAFWLSVEHAGILLRDSELEDIEHYFVYTADEWARYHLGSPIHKL